MPKELEQKLWRQIAKDPVKRKWSMKKKKAYVYSVLRKTGWKPSK